MAAKTKSNDKPGCAVCNPDDHPPKGYDERRAEAEATFETDVVIARCETRSWGVISKSGAYLHENDEGYMHVIHGGLYTREAAEVARHDAMLGVTSPTHRHPYGHSGASNAFYNTAGRVLELLRDNGAQHENLVALAYVITPGNIFQPPSPGGPQDDEVPF